jgi:hypothetical protein
MLEQKYYRFKYAPPIAAHHSQAVFAQARDVPFRIEELTVSVTSHRAAALSKQEPKFAENFA